MDRNLDMSLRTQSVIEVVGKLDSAEVLIEMVVYEYGVGVLRLQEKLWRSWRECDDYTSVD